MCVRVRVCDVITLLFKVTEHVSIYVTMCVVTSTATLAHVMTFPPSL